MKAVLISIRPKWCVRIASGEKIIEVRKTRPNHTTPFKCYIYETKGKVERPREDEDGYIYQEGRGAVIGEFVCDHVESTNCFSGWVCPEKNNIIKRFLDGSCLSEQEIVDYADGRSVCGWHISALKMYDEPKPLSELHSDCAKCGYVNARGGNCDFTIKRPPQSWCYVRCAP